MELVAFSPGTVTLTLRAEDSPAFDLSAPAGPTVSLSSPNTQLVLEVGTPGPVGPVGPAGAQGAPGVGVPAGGLEGQVLIKNTDTSYDTIWSDNYATEVRVQVRNETGATLTKGTVVYINGSSGNKVTVTKAIANSDATSAQTLGIMTADLTTNQNGYATVLGLVKGLDTTAYTAGAQLYLSPTVAGAMTATKPSAPQHMVYVAIVERVHANQGSLMVRPQNGFEIEELHNVSVTAVANGDLLVYESATSLWKNQSATTSGLATMAWVDSQGYLQAGALTGYALQSWVTAGFYPLSSNPAGYLTSASLSGYETSAHAAATYYLQTNPAGYITASSLSGYATEAWVTSQGYLTSASLSGYATQSWVTSQGYLTASALTPYATLASPTFTGDPKAPTPATADNDTSVATTAFVKNQGYITTANATANFYPLSSNPAGYLTSSALAGYALLNGSSAFSVTGSTIKSFDGSDNFAALDQGSLNFGNGSTPSGIVINGSSITFADSTVQTTAATGGIPDAPSDGNTYGRNNGAWVIAGGGSGAGTLTYSSGQLYDTSTASFVPDLTLLTLTAGTVTGVYGLTLQSGSGGVLTFADATTQSTAAVGIPSGGTTGQVLAKNSASDYDASWATPSGGGGGVDIQTFGSSTTSGTFTWTKPAGAKIVEVYLWGAGGSGASGARQATTVARNGGGAGGAGTLFNGRIHASYLAATETVVIGASVAGGVPQTLNSSGGINPTATPTATTFSIFRAQSGNNGSFSGGAGRPSILGVSAVTAGAGGSGAYTSGGVGTPTTYYNLVSTGGGGGAGAGASSTSAAQGGQGAAMNANTNGAGIITTIAGGTGGWLGTPATSGTSATTEMFRGGTGGGGGGYLTNTAGGTGGNGGWPGGGGGGGGASDNGFNSGAGGAGANGYAVIITYC